MLYVFLVNRISGGIDLVDAKCACAYMQRASGTSCARDVTRLHRHAALAQVRQHPPRHLVVSIAAALRTAQHPASAASAPRALTASASLARSATPACLPASTTVSAAGRLPSQVRTLYSALRFACLAALDCAIMLLLHALWGVHFAHVLRSIGFKRNATASCNLSHSIACASP